MAGPIVVADDESFKSHLDNAGDKLVVIDFHATWCNPCKRIAPVFLQLSLKYPQAIFLKVDVDICSGTAGKYGVTAMPTFIFIKSKVKIKELKGADPNELQELVKTYAGAANAGTGSGEDSEVPGHSDLAPFFLAAGCDCLNENDEHKHANVLKKGGGHLESDCDEQLMLTIAFNQAVKIHSLKIHAPNDGRGPKTIKIFVNQPNAVDFDQGESMEAVQKLILQESDLDGEKLIPLRFVKFQNVSNIVLFVVDNQGGEEVTVIHYLKLIGCPLIGTNMNEFKRVAGKAGESH